MCGQLNLTLLPIEVGSLHLSWCNKLVVMLGLKLGVKTGVNLDVLGVKLGAKIQYWPS